MKKFITNDNNNKDFVVDYGFRRFSQVTAAALLVYYVLMQPPFNRKFLFKI